MGVSLDIGFFFDLLGTYRAALSVAGEVNLAVSAEIQFKGILRYGRFAYATLMSLTPIAVSTRMGSWTRSLRSTASVSIKLMPPWLVASLAQLESYQNSSSR